MVKGSKMTLESREKLRLSHLGQKSWLKGGHLSKKTKKLITKKLLGRKLSEEVKKKMSTAKQESGTHLWRGDKVGYSGKHRRVIKKLGQPSLCSLCGRSDGSPRCYHWANISREYRLELTDWIRLCASCHQLYDKGKLSLNKK